MTKILRPAARQAHIWIGLPLGLLFCVMGLSGSIILYRDAIEAALRPAWNAAGHSKPTFVLDEVDHNMRRLWPDATPTQISFPHTGGEPYEYQFRAGGRAVHAYFDAATGELLGVFNLPWLDWITGFHKNLRLPPSGRQLVGVIGIGLCLSSLSGVVIWLLRTRAWLSTFRIAWGASSNRLSFDVHRAVGIAANVFLLILSFTGVCLGFPDTFRSFSEFVTAAKSARAPQVAVATATMQQRLDSYVAAAKQALPDGVARELRFPRSADGPVTLRIWRKGDYRDEGSNQVSLDPATARVLSVDKFENWSAARKLASAPSPIHYAEWGGPLAKPLWAVAGLTPSILFVSGFWFWFAGYRARAKRTRQAEGSSVLVAR